MSKNKYYVIVLDRERHVLTTEKVLGYQEARDFGTSYPGVKYYALFKDCPPSLAMILYHDEWKGITTNRFLQILRNNNEEADFGPGAPRWISRHGREPGDMERRLHSDIHKD